MSERAQDKNLLCIDLKLLILRVSVHRSTKKPLKMLNIDEMTMVSQGLPPDNLFMVTAFLFYLLL